MKKNARCIMITGSSKGLGRALALRFARAHYNLIIHGRNEQRLKDTRKEILKHGGSCNTIKGDIVAESTVKKLILAAKAEDLSIFINNAAIYNEAKLLSISSENLIKKFRINLISPIILMEEIFLMLAAKKDGGIIININSSAAKIGDRADAVYTASKCGLRGFSKSMKDGGVVFNVRILDVYLGAMKTDMVRHRENFDKFINVKEVADIIFRLTKDYRTLTIREVEIGRRNY